MNKEAAFLSFDCPNYEWSGDGQCDSINNIPACNFDGGDCDPRPRYVHANLVLCGQFFAICKKISLSIPNQLFFEK